MPKDYAEIANRLSAEMKEVGKAKPEVTAAFAGLGKAVYSDAALTRRTKELIALAIAITVRCDGCVAFHARQAVEAWATREEVVDTIGVAVQMGGGPSMVYGADALSAYDQFAG